MEKIALFYALVAYLLKYSSAIISIRNALAVNPLFSSQVELLNSAKVLLSKV